MKIFLLFILTLAFLQSCAPKTRSHENEEIVAAMKEYDRLLLTMNADSIAAIYDLNGDLGKVAHGRDSIRNFLRSFKNIKMLSQASTSEVVVIVGDSARQEGTYAQVDVVDRDTIKVRGTYVAIWKWNDDERWRIKRMETTPLQ